MTSTTPAKCPTTTFTTATELESILNGNLRKNSFITSRIDYCKSLLYGLPKYHLAKLQRIQNAAAQAIYRAPRYTSAHSTQRGFCCVIITKCRIICSQSLFLGAAYQGLSTSFQISTAKFYPNQYLPFLSHTANAFLSASIHSPSPQLHSLCTSLGPQPLRC